MDVKRGVALAGTACAVLVIGGALGTYMASRYFTGDESSLSNTSNSAKADNQTNNTVQVTAATLQADSQNLLHDTTYFLSGAAVKDYIKGDFLRELGYGDEQYWNEFTKPSGWYDILSADVKKMSDDVQSSNMADKAKYEQDLQDMQSLLDIAKQHKSTLGATLGQQCLIYFQQAAEDLHYSLTGSGSHNGVTETEGSQIIHLFIQPYLGND